MMEKYEKCPSVPVFHGTTPSLLEDYFGKFGTSPNNFFGFSLSPNGQPAVSLRSLRRRVPFPRRPR